MARTTPELVATVIDVDAGDVLDSYIDTASELVTEVCTASGYSDARLELIERWLSAHFYDVNRPRASTETAGSVSQQNEPVRVDLGLSLTKYGQTAMRLDTKGNLAALDNAMKTVKVPLSPAAGGKLVGTKWVGTPLCDL